MVAQGDSTGTKLESKTTKFYTDITINPIVFGLNFGGNIPNYLFQKRTNLGGGLGLSFGGIVNIDKGQNKPDILQKDFKSFLVFGVIFKGSYSYNKQLDNSVTDKNIGAIAFGPYFGAKYIPFQRKASFLAIGVNIELLGTFVQTNTVKTKSNIYYGTFNGCLNITIDLFEAGSNLYNFGSLLGLKKMKNGNQ